MTGYRVTPFVSRPPINVFSGHFPGPRWGQELGGMDAVSPLDLTAVRPGGRMLLHKSEIGYAYTHPNPFHGAR